MKTINERVDDLCHILRGQGSSVNPTAYTEMTLLLRELAKDQRHLCAEAVAGVEYGAAAYQAAVQMKAKCHQAVMNADIK